MKLISPDFRVLLGAIGFIVCLLIFSFSGLENYNPNSTIGASMIAFSSTLLAAGIFKKKQN
jgi:hypothetical protein